MSTPVSSNGRSPGLGPGDARSIRAAGTNAIERLLRFLSIFACGLRGHDALLHFEQGRISMKCTSCPYETPGWDCKAA
jgi:hypothetical protein